MMILQSKGDTFVICSFSVLLILVTGLWKEAVHADTIVALALAQYFPYVDKIWPIFIFLLGYSSIIAFSLLAEKLLYFSHLNTELNFILFMLALPSYSFRS